MAFKNTLWFRVYLVVFDAEGTLNAGILDGNTQWLGKFPECMRVHAKTGYIEPSNQTWVPRDFRGRYCKSYWNIPLPGNVSVVPCHIGLVASVFASHAAGRGFASRPGHTKDLHNNGTNCLPA